MMMKFSIWQIIGALFHPSYMLVNSKLLGTHKTPEAQCAVGMPDVGTIKCVSATTYLASFGLASSTLGILMLATSMCFAMGLSNVLPQAYGSGEYKLCGAYVNRMIICVSMWVIPMALFLEIFSPSLMALLVSDKNLMVR